MTNKILDEIMENITELLPNFIYKGVNTKQALNYIRKKHEEYADWKIKECIDFEDFNNKIDCLIGYVEAAGNGKYPIGDLNLLEVAKEASEWKDQILYNKDKKK